MRQEEITIKYYYNEDPKNLLEAFNISMSDMMFISIEAVKSLKVNKNYRDSFFEMLNNVPESLRGSVLLFYATCGFRDSIKEGEDISKLINGGF